jgi:hypothetical protein
MAGRDPYHTEVAALVVPYPPALRLIFRNRYYTRKDCPLLRYGGKSDIIRASY